MPSLKALSRFKNLSFSEVLFIAISKGILPTEASRNIKKKERKAEKKR